MEEIIISIIRAEITAAEAAFEMNPCGNMDEWWERLENECTQTFPLKMRETA